MKEDKVKTNIMLKLKCRDNTNHNIYIELPKDTVEAGLFDYAEAFLFFQERNL